MEKSTKIFGAEESCKLLIDKDNMLYMDMDPPT